MEANNFKEKFSRLVSLDHTDDPVISCYVNHETLKSEYKDILYLRVVEIRKVLPESAKASFEEALEFIEAYLTSEKKDHCKSRALFARGGEKPFLEVFECPLSLQTEISVDSMPHLYQLILMKDIYDSYVVLISESSHARIIEVSIGSITKELWVDNPSLKKLSGRSWTKEHYQNHHKNRSNKFLKEKVKILEQLFREGKHRYLIIAGYKQSAVEIKKNLPKSLQEKVIDFVQTENGVPTESVIRGTLSAFESHEQNESLDRAELLLQRVMQDRLAATDTIPVLNALRRGQVDVLLMSEDYDPQDVYMCASCFKAGSNQVGVTCSRCGKDDIRSIHAKEEILHLVERTSATIEILRNSSKLDQVNGVGCLLRY